MYEIRNTHRVIPPMVIDVDNRLIHPSKYRRELMGALVEVRFTMTHCVKTVYLDRPKVDEYFADIVSIRIIQPPPKTSQEVDDSEDVGEGSSGRAVKRKKIA